MFLKTYIADARDGNAVFYNWHEQKYYKVSRSGCWSPLFLLELLFSVVLLLIISPLLLELWCNDFLHVNWTDFRYTDLLSPWKLVATMFFCGIILGIFWQMTSEALVKLGMDVELATYIDVNRSFGKLASEWDAKTVLEVSSQDYKIYFLIVFFVLSSVYPLYDTLFNKVSASLIYHGGPMLMGPFLVILFVALSSWTIIYSVPRISLMKKWLKSRQIQ